MRLDPVVTFFIYIAAALLVFTVCAAVADYWLARYDDPQSSAAQSGEAMHPTRERES